LEAEGGAEVVESGVNMPERGLDGVVGPPAASVGFGVVPWG
jgi:hypothetical protein